MFNHINTFFYGRCIKDSTWYLQSQGINRLYYIHRGSVDILLDKRPYRLHAGPIYLLPQNLNFELLLTSQTEVDHTFFDFYSFPTIKMDGLIELDPKENCFVEKAAFALFELAEAFPTYPSAERNDYSDVIESYLSNLLFLIDKHVPINVISDERINRSLDYIHKHYATGVTIDDLIQINNLDKNYFIRLFRQIMNITPHQYIMKYRFNIALSMIKRGASVTDAALAIGYNDLSSFSHAFKKFYGIAPNSV